MKTLYLVRHGETKWNHELRYLGHSDIPLNKTGQKQAKALAKRIKGLKVDLILASDLKRTMQTAKAANSTLKTEIKKEPRLREIFFGEIEGVESKIAKKRFAKELKKWMEDPDYALPGGESLGAFSNRLISLLNDIKKMDDVDSIMLVTHNGVIRVMIQLLLDLPQRGQWYFKFKPTSISEVRFVDGFPVIQYLNSACHLKKD